VKINGVVLKKMRFDLGQSLFEVVIAVGIIGLIITAVVILATSSIRNTTYSRNKSLATRYSQEAVEWLRGQRDTNWLNFHNYAITSAVYCFDALNWTKARACNAGEVISDTILQRQATFSNITGTSITTTVAVFWSDSQGLHQVSTSTVFTDWRAK